jgi:hypothetical protein
MVHVTIEMSSNSFDLIIKLHHFKPYLLPIAQPIHFLNLQKSQALVFVMLPWRRQGKEGLAFHFGKIPLLVQYVCAKIQALCPKVG